MQFRRATIADVPAVVRLVNDAASGDGGTAGWTNEAHLFHGDRTDAREIAELMTIFGASFVLAHERSSLVGCAYLKVATPRAYLGLLSVSPHHQGQGLGSDIVAECERIARQELHCDLLEISVITSHRPEVTAFYERRGFVRTGKLKPFERKQAREGKKVEGMQLEWMEKPLAVRTPVLKGIR